MNQKVKRHYVIYSRKSKFTGKGESIENQIEMCRQYIFTHYGKQEAESAFVYEDEGFSGGTLERPQFKKMMADSQSTEFAAIVVYRLDRISRNIGDFAKLIEDLNSRNIDFISIREQFDTSSPMGRAMMYIASVFSQLERETIAERIRDNMHELAKTGRWLGGNTPLGYNSESISTVTLDAKTRKACKLKEIPDEIALVNLIFEKFIGSGSLTKTDEFLLNGGYKTKRGKDFTRFAIKGILSNPVYMIADADAYNYLIQKNVELFSEKSEFDGTHGIMAYNRTKQQRGKSTKETPAHEWIVSVGKHRGTIAGEEWVRAQKLLEINRSKSYRKPRSNNALLSALLYCGKCGNYMRPKLTSRKNCDGNRIYTYLCTTKERSQSVTCDMINANGNLLDAKVLDAIKGLLNPSTALAKKTIQIKKRIVGKRENQESEIDKLKAAIDENNKEIKALITSLGKVKESSAEKYIIDKIEKLHNTIEAFQKRIIDLEEVASRHALTDTEFKSASKKLSSIKECVDSYNVEQKRALIRAFTNKIIWDGEGAHLYLLGSDNAQSTNTLPQNNNPFHTKSQNISHKPLGEDSE